MRVAGGNKWTRRAHTCLWFIFYGLFAWASLIALENVDDLNVGRVWVFAFMTGLAFGMMILTGTIATNEEFEEEAIRRGYTKIPTKQLDLLEE